MLSNKNVTEEMIGVFSERLNELLYHLQPARPGTLLNPEAWRELDAGTIAILQKSAEKALKCPVAPLPFTQFLNNPAGYVGGKRERREQLMALTLGACAEEPGRYLARLIDVIWAICEESSWTEGRNAPDPLTPERDLAAYETASLIAWTHELLGKALDDVHPAITERMRTEVGRRIIAPFLARESTEVPGRKEGNAIPCLTRLLSALILIDPDDRRRWSGIRKCLILMDGCLRGYPIDGGNPRGIEGWQADACALSDAATLLLMATLGEVDFRGEKALTALCAYPLSAHLDRGYFVNPDGSPVPRVSGAALFRVGECLDDDELRALGACVNALYPARGEPDGMTARVLNAMLRMSMLSRAAVWPQKRDALLRFTQIARASGEDFTCAIHGGSFTSGHIDAGDIQVYYRGRPVFCDLGGNAAGADMHSLPGVNGVTPTMGRGGVKDLSVESEAAYTCLCVNLAPGFPAPAGVTSWARTVMLSRFEKCVRIVEAADLARAGQTLTFRFITPERPEPAGEDGYFVADTLFRWEGAMTRRVDALSAGWAITLTMENAPARGNYAFTIFPRY